MNQRLQIIKNKKSLVNVSLKTLDISYIEKILSLQNSMYNSLSDKQIFVKTSDEELVDYLNGKASVMGIVTENDDLAAVGIYIEAGINRDNYGCDLGLSGSEVLNVGQIDTVIVDEKFRGNSLQKFLCRTLEEQVCRKNGKKIIAATVSPFNSYSLNNFLSLGYEIKSDKLKYNGVRRYTVAKELI